MTKDEQRYNEVVKRYVKEYALEDFLATEAKESGDEEENELSDVESLSSVGEDEDDEDD